MIGICAPTRYLVAFKKHVGSKRLLPWKAMKSHDHHVTV
jgi:hypothetical protein